jgi:hypothetical protein
VRFAGFCTVPTNKQATSDHKGLVGVLLCLVFSSVHVDFGIEACGGSAQDSTKSVMESRIRNPLPIWSAP